ncbi:MAG: hypothetical protein JW780_04905 [Clostridiales bacterium]|nr:hypothetical protein [Clostridiales bacterium]
MCGDNRFYNNVFLGTQEQNRPKEASMDLTGWYHGGIIWDEAGVVAKGLTAYDKCPIPEEWAKWCKEPHDVSDFATAKLPVYIGSNLYLGDASMYAKGEADSARISDEDPQVVLSEDSDKIFLKVNMSGHPEKIKTRFVTSELLGKAFQPRARFENSDGSAVCIDEDYFGKKRDGE